MTPESNIKSYTLIWVTTQLRVDDNRLLQKAKELGLPTLAIYCIDEKYTTPWMNNIPRLSKQRKAFLNAQLKEFHADLQQLNVPLKLSKGNTLGLIKELLESYSITHFVYPKEIGVEEIKIQEKVLQALPENIEKHDVIEGYLLDPKDTTFGIENTPEVFTQFRKLQEKALKEYEEIQPPVLPKHNVYFELPEWVKEEGSDQFPFVPGENAGQERLKYYLWESKKAAQYKHTRNGLMGTDFSTRFSPYLATGALSPRNIYREVKRFERKVKKNSSTYWITFELLWRDFFRYMMLKHKSSSFHKHGYNQAELPDLSTEFSIAQEWMNGKTKSAFINAGMKELNTTGWLSNRMRQNVASYLINEMGCDWRIGAAYFEYKLLDYDVCSNTGNWLYLSGYGNDPRGRRAFNTHRQQQEYDPNQDYVQHWIMQKAGL